MDDIVSLKVATLAKKVGFNLKVDYAFWSPNHPDDLPKDEIYQYSSYKNELLEYISAPTQSHLQKWLRKEKKIAVLVNPIDSWRSWKYTILMEDIMSPFFEPDYDKFNQHLTYEDALESGLINALKLLSS